jgi:hypothetical protein
MARPDTFTIGVFVDAAWATRGLDALEREGFPAQVLSLVAGESSETIALARRLAPDAEAPVTIPPIGRCVAVGPLRDVLEGDDADLTRRGLAATMRRAGFLAHDARIFESLTARGGVLVAVRSESRAADALAKLHAYGGANAAIGAWHDRV